MSWICTYCDTENDEKLDECEVCDKLRTDKPFILDFTVPAMVAYEKPENITWHTENAVRVFLNSNEYEPNGQCQISIKKDTTITLRVLGKNGKEIKASKYIAIDIKTIPPTIKVFSVPSRIDYNKPFEIKWATENAAEVYLNNKKVEGIGSLALVTKTAKKYTLTAIAKNGLKTTKTINAKVFEGSYPPQILSFDVPENVDYGVYFNISWVTKNATKVLINRKTKEPTSSMNEMICNDTEYTIVAKNDIGDKVSLTKTVTIAPDSYPAKIDIIAPKIVPYGSDVTIKWTTQNTKAVILNDCNVMLNDEYTIKQLCSSTTLIFTTLSQRDNPVREKIKIDIDPETYPVKICSFTASPNKVTKWGETINLKWKTEFPCQYYIDGTLIKGNSITVKITKTHTYKLLCKNKIHQETASINISCPPCPPPPKIIFIDLPKEVYENHSATIKYRCENVAELYNGNEKLPLEGSITKKFKSKSRYILRAIGEDETKIYKKIDIAIVPPLSAIFLVDYPKEVASETNYTIKWDCKYASSLKLNGEKVQLADKKTFRSITDTTLSFVLTDLKGNTKNYNYVVKVINKPYISASASSNDVIEGEMATIHWSITDATSATLNGVLIPLSGTKNVVINSPIITICARNRLSSTTKEIRFNLKNAEEPTLEFPPLPNYVAKGDTITFNWRAKNIKKLYLIKEINGITSRSEVYPKNSLPLFFINTGKVKLTFEYYGYGSYNKKRERYTTTSVIEKPQINTLKTTSCGHLVTLKWDTANATSVKITLSGINISLPNTYSGNYTFYAPTDFSVTLEARNQAELVTKSINVLIDKNYGTLDCNLIYKANSKVKFVKHIRANVAMFIRNLITVFGTLLYMHFFIDKNDIKKYKSFIEIASLSLIAIPIITLIYKLIKYCIFAAKFDYIGDKTEGVTYIAKKSKLGLIDLTELKILLKCKYDAILKLDNIPNCFCVNKNGKIGVYNILSNKKIIPIKYESILVQQNSIHVTKGTKTYSFDINGNKLN